MYICTRSSCFRSCWTVLISVTSCWWFSIFSVPVFPCKEAVLFLSRNLNLFRQSFKVITNSLVLFGFPVFSNKIKFLKFCFHICWIKWKQGYILGTNIVNKLIFSAFVHCVVLLPLFARQLCVGCGLWEWFERSLTSDATCTFLVERNDSDSCAHCVPAPSQCSTCRNLVPRVLYYPPSKKYSRGDPGN